MKRYIGEMKEEFLFKYKKEHIEWLELKGKNEYHKSEMRNQDNKWTYMGAF